MECRAVYEASALEVRRSGGRRVIGGSFPYGSLAVLADRGTVRKESILPGAFDFALSDPDREISLLFGHDFNRPLASKKRGTLTFDDGPEALAFEAVIDPELAEVSHVRDALTMLGAGLVTGISPGFRVPPKETVPGAERLRPEPGNPSVMIRELIALILYEISLVTRPAYEDAQAELRAMQHRAPQAHRVFLP